MRIIYTIVTPDEDIQRLVRKKIIQAITHNGKTFVARWSTNKANLLKIAKRSKI